MDSLVAVRASRTLPVVRALIARPMLWPAALRQALRLAPERWWTRPPFLPVPSDAYLRFRAETQYGDAGHALVPDDVAAYVAWCRQVARLGPGSEP